MAEHSSNAEGVELVGSIRRQVSSAAEGNVTTASRLRRWGRAAVAAGTVVCIAVVVVIFGSSGDGIGSDRSVSTNRRWQVLSSRGMQTAQLMEAEQSAVIARAFAGDDRGRDGSQEDQGVDEDIKGLDVDQIAFGQWFRAESLRKWYGSAGPNHVHDVTHKMKFITRLDCAAAVEYHIEHVAKDCHFPCGPCEGNTFRAKCSLLHKGYCADCAGCGKDFWRTGCGGPEAPFEIIYDPERIRSFEDVLKTVYNSSQLEGHCVPCAECDFGAFRKECGGQDPGYCTPCEDCEAGKYRADCGLVNNDKGYTLGFSNPGECVDCEVCPAGQFIPDCHYMNKGSCRACTVCNASEYTAIDCTGTADRVCSPCADLPQCGVGHFREGCGFGSEGQCVPCRGTEPGYYRVECGSPGVTMAGVVVEEPGFPLEGGHTVKCDTCEADYFRDACGGADEPLSPGVCKRCEDCGHGNWRDGCGTPWSVWIYPGDCKPCQNCGENKFLTGCEYLSPGTCADCKECSADEYMVTQCSNSADRTCAPCSSLPTCPPGQYRKDCGLGNEGECAPCPVPPLGFYHVQCGGLSPGRDVRCGECAEGHFNYNCKDNSPGQCELCGACEAGEYRAECGTWIDPGHCEPCPQCPAEHHLVNCKGNSPGSCAPCYVCARDEYETMPCTNSQNRECAKCAQLPSCGEGFYRADCGLGSEGTCKACAACPEGSFRQGCGGESPGTCAACGECPEGFYREGCDGESPGVCKACADCPEGFFRVGCLGSDPGHCQACQQCGEHEYASRECSGTSPQHHDRQCLPCDSLTCSPGSYRKGCGNNPAGVCTLCPDKCQDGDFLVGCGGEDEGACGPCALDCPEDQYRKDCQYLDAGACTDCPVCPQGYFSKGCGGLHAGACIACDSLPCPPNMERVQCGGKSEGYCDQIWLAWTPPPETILWGAFLTENPTPDCVDTGGNDLPGLTRKFKITNSIMRLAACTEATAAGSYTLKAKGNWLLSFYVGIPAYDSKPYEAPAAYPLEKDGEPDATDTLEVTINGFTQTFENKPDEYIGNKLVFYHMLDDTNTVDFKFVWKSSNSLDHLHLFASTGTAAFIGDHLPIEKAVAYQTTHLGSLNAGAGKIMGDMMNAVDGFKIKPKKQIKTGYKIHHKVVRASLPDRDGDLTMLIGSSKMYDVAVSKGSFVQEAAAGTYACVANYPGFYPAFYPACEIDGNKVSNRDMVLCPYLNPGHGRFILTWGEEPSDMDVYLDAPDGKGGRCTVMYKDKFCQQVGKGKEESRIHLDHDVTKGYGPETLTIEGFIPGEYLLRVKHYRGFSCVDKRTNFDKCLAESKAMVSFYMDIHQYRFEIGKHGYTHDIQWVIAKINGATREVTMCTPELCPPTSDATDRY